MTKAPIVLVAGGTGGHLFPAQALAEQLVKFGREVVLVSDRRVDHWVDHFPGDIHIITSGTVTGAGIVSKLRGGYRLLKGLRQSLKLLDAIRPAMVVGFGGYPSVPPLLAAHWRKIPTLIHEQNAVMGRANRFLAPRVDMIATGFPEIDTGFPDKSHFVGNPVRRPVMLAADKPYDPPRSQGKFRLLVFGGSQGARVLSDVMPNAIGNLSEDIRERLQVTQQAREEDMQRVINFYTRIKVAHQVEAFYEDMPARIADTHLVIARAGASTVAELGVIGRPAILVPLPGALDQDQAANAEALVKVGGAIAVPQSAFTPVSVAEMLGRLVDEADLLANMAEAARKISTGDASARLATHILSILGKD